MNIKQYLFLLSLTLCGAQATFAMESDSPSQKAQKEEQSAINDQNMSREEKAKLIVEQLIKDNAAMAADVKTLKAAIERPQRIAEMDQMTRDLMQHLDEARHLLDELEQDRRLIFLDFINNNTFSIILFILGFYQYMYLSTFSK